MEKFGLAKIANSPKLLLAWFLGQLNQLTGNSVVGLSLENFLNRLPTA